MARNKQKKRPGRPKKCSHELKADYLDVRLETVEKQTFKDAADLAGIPLSTWVRERLRVVSKRELTEAGRPVLFLRHPAKKGRDGEP